MEASCCVELNEKSNKPLTQEAGEMLEYMPQAFPTFFGFLYSPTASTNHSSWLRIGEQCKNVACGGYGLGVFGTPLELLTEFSRNIQAAVDKVDKHPKWKKTPLTKIKACTCREQDKTVAVGLPPLLCE
jgi:hypothetical protein